MKKYLLIILFLLTTFVSATEFNGAISNNVGTDENSGSLTGVYSNNLAGTIKYTDNHSCSINSECYSGICCTNLCSSSCSDSNSDSGSDSKNSNHKKSSSSNSGSSIDLNTLAMEVDTGVVNLNTFSANAKSEFLKKGVVIPLVLVGVLTLLILVFIKIIRIKNKHLNTS